MATIKITEAQMFEAIKSMIETGVFQYQAAEGTMEVDSDEVAAFCEKKLDALARKAAKARETAASKKAEGDELTEIIYQHVSEEPITIEDMVAALDDETVTRGKVQYRLSALAKEGRVVKTEVSTTGADGKKRHVAAYALPGEDF